MADKLTMMAVVVFVSTTLWFQGCGDDSDGSSPRPTPTPTPVAALCGSVVCPVGQVCCNPLASTCVGPGEFCAL